MTDTETKALALVNEVFMERCLVPAIYTNRAGNPYHEALCRAIERLEATEVRHAEEMRELKERFSEALVAIRRRTVPQRCHDAFDELAAPFIIAKPDPLVEAIRSAMPKALVAYDTYDAIVMDVAAAVRKIGEAGE